MKRLFSVLQPSPGLWLAGCLLSYVLWISGCTAIPQSHWDKVASVRARLPWTTPVGNTHSMSGIINAGSTITVHAKPYYQVQAGDIVVFWPWGKTSPLCHMVGSRLGTDSWETYGTHNDRGDLTGLGAMLTRENYIGVVW